MAPTGRNPGGRTRITPALRDQVEQLARDGVGRNKIVRITGVSAGSVFNICKAADPPILFDRAATEAATRARQVDLADRRAELELLFLIDAKEDLAKKRQPCTVFNIGGKDNIYTEHHLDLPPTRDLKDLTQSSSIALTASLKLAAHDSDSGTGPAKSLLGDLMRGLRIAYEEPEETP